MPLQISKFWIPLTLHFQSIHNFNQSLVSGGSSQCSSSSWNGSASRGDSFFVVFIININYLCHGIYFSSCVLIFSKNTFTDSNLNTEFLKNWKSIDNYQLSYFYSASWSLLWEAGTETTPLRAASFLTPQSKAKSISFLK